MWRSSSITQLLANMILDPVVLGSIPSNPKIPKLPMLLRLLNGAALRKVDIGMKMFIKPIYYYL